VESDQKITKAKVLSIIASIYDPIGWIGPVVVAAKLFMKKLWINKISWNDSLQEEMMEEWCEFSRTLPSLNELKIPRRCLIDNAVTVELHGFCDASIEAYGAVIYVRSMNEVGETQVSMLCSKSRVAPKTQKTLARLELCSATLLAKLIDRYANVLSVKVSGIILWSDSTIVLNWITMLPSKFQTFVGNRVAVIQELTNKFKWRHIRGNLNPADVISRGLLPHEISESELWWNGPEFLKLPKEEWPESIITVNEDDPEIKLEVKKTFTITAANNLFDFIETRHSSSRKTARIFAYALRFVSNIRKSSMNRKIGVISVEELENAETEIIKIVQKTMFPSEYKVLQAARDDKEAVQQVSKQSTLISLAPFMDEKGVLRVRGRIGASEELTFDQKHQVIIPSCNFAVGIVRDLHMMYLHPTKMTLQSMICQKYWIIKVKKTIKKVQHECIKCFRAKPTTTKQLMSDLPEARVVLTTPFVNTAVDYTGYYQLKTGTSRSTSTSKVYVVVFKCMCTGAIHLDVATDLSAQAFIAVLDRFVSRRGLCSQLFSDNATCFRGSDNLFKKMLNSLHHDVKEYCATKMIKWHFTTPRSPSAGGIYESGVKAMKHHLNRLLDRPFTYEQFYTILCKIEAILNSRPITPMSNDPEDVRALTPGHFLIGRALTTLPESNQLDRKSAKVTHWEGLQKIQQKFWQLWYHDYLRQMQTRPAGFREEVKFKLGDLVLLRDENLPPMKWLLGRIVKMFPGKDKVVRNVRVKTQDGDKERNVRYLSLLPVEM
jgi:hypothetical protein